MIKSTVSTIESNGHMYYHCKFEVLRKCLQPLSVVTGGYPSVGVVIIDKAVMSTSMLRRPSCPTFKLNRGC